MVGIIPYERSTLVNDEKYIGLDVHQATIVVAVLDSKSGSPAWVAYDESREPARRTTKTPCRSRCLVASLIRARNQMVRSRGLYQQPGNLKLPMRVCQPAVLESWPAGV
jgi:hypothetical protein